MENKYLTGKYLATKEGEPVDALTLNATLSTIFTPIVPANHSTEDNTHYEINENNFNVLESKKGATIDGKISYTLIGRLKHFGIELK